MPNAAINAVRSLPSHTFNVGNRALRTHPTRRNAFDVVNDNLVTIGYMFVTPRYYSTGCYFPDVPVSATYTVTDMTVGSIHTGFTIHLKTKRIHVDGVPFSCWYAESMLDALRLISLGRMLPVPEVK